MPGISRAEMRKNLYIGELWLSGSNVFLAVLLHHSGIIHGVLDAQKMTAGFGNGVRETGDAAPPLRRTTVDPGP